MEAALKSLYVAALDRELARLSDTVALVMEKSERERERARRRGKRKVSQSVKLEDVTGVRELEQAVTV
jgi:hypothetical protein